MTIDHRTTDAARGVVSFLGVRRRRRQSGGGSQHQERLDEHGPTRPSISGRVFHDEFAPQTGESNSQRMKIPARPLEA